jgi:hypothetical protein
MSVGEGAEAIEETFSCHGLGPPPEGCLFLLEAVASSAYGSCSISRFAIPLQNLGGCIRDVRLLSRKRIDLAGVGSAGSPDAEGVRCANGTAPAP